MNQLLSTFILILLTFSISYSQNVCYEVVAKVQENNSIDDEHFQMMKQVFENRVFYQDDYLIYFQRSSKRLEDEEDKFHFSEVQILDNRNELYYSKKNGHRKFKEIPDAQSMIPDVGKLTASEESMVINDYNCKEYKINLRDGKYSSLFITTDLPNIKHLPLSSEVPGFLIQMDTYSNDDKISIHYELKEVEKDPTYFKYLDELKQQFPRPLKYTSESFTNAKELHPNISKQMKRLTSRLTYYNNEIKNFQPWFNHNEKINIAIKEKYGKNISYFNSTGQKTHDLSLRRSSNELSVYNYNNEGHLADATKNGELFIKVHEDTLSYYKNGNKYKDEVYNDKQRTIEKIADNTHEINYFNKQDLLIKSEYDNGSKIFVSKHEYKKGNLIKATSTRKQQNTPDEIYQVFNYNYHPSGLIKKKILEGVDTTIYNYIIKDQSKFDTIYLISKEENKKEELHTYIFDEYQNLIENKTIIYHDDTKLSTEHQNAQHKLLSYYLKSYIEADSVATSFETKFYDNSISSFKKYPFLFYDLVDSKKYKSNFRGLDIIPMIKLHSLIEFKEDNQAIYYKVYFNETVIGSIDEENGKLDKILTSSKQIYGQSVMLTYDEDDLTLEWENGDNFVIAKKDKTTNEWEIIK